MGLPWIGFAFGCTIARLTKRPAEDVIAIAIETGVQNTGMAIFILWFTLDQPMGDMTGISKKKMETFVAYLHPPIRNWYRMPYFQFLTI